MKKYQLFSLGFVFIVIIIFFRSFFLQGNIPAPTDTLVNLFHPFRDYYAAEYPRGIPYKNSLVTDPITQIIPWKDLSLSLLTHFQLPLWNPYQMAGYPLLGNIQSSAFYPFNILLLLPFTFGWSLFIFIQQTLAAYFMVSYLRNRGLSGEASALGGLTFAFSGFMIAWLEWGTIAHTALWLPLIILSIDKVVEDRKYRWAIGIGVGVLFGFLAGHLQTFIYSTGVSLLYLIFRYFFSHRDRKSLIISLISFIVAAIVASPLVIQQMQFVLLSARNVDLSWHQAGWFIPLPQVIQFIAPDFFGNPATGNYWGVWNYGEFIGYLGIVVILLTLTALFYKRNKDVIFWSVIAVLAGIFAFQTPIAKIPYKLDIPFLASTQPTRLIFIIDVAFAIIASYGLDSLRKIKRVIYLPQIILILLLAGVIIFGYTGHLNNSINSENWRVLTRNLIVPSFLIILFSIILLLVSILKGKKKQIVVYALLVLTAVDLLFFAQKFTPFSKTEYFYPTTKAIRYLQNQPGQFRIMAVDRRILHPNISTKFRLQSIDGYDPLYLLRYGEMLAASGRRKPDISSPFGYFRILTPDNYDTPIINLLGVKYILSLSEINNPVLVKVFEEGETKIYRNDKALPRAFFVSNVKHAKDKEQAIIYLFDNSLDLQDTAIIEGSNRVLASKKYTKGVVTISTYSENKIILHTQSEGEGFLVVTDTDYPIWHAYIDKKEVQIHRTDYNFRGIVVPKGAHTVEFRAELY